MNPLRLRATNYRTFKSLDLELPAGCSAILGINGAGKSSLVNLVDLCLFGPEGRSWAPYLTQGGESTELEVELTFEHAARVWRIRRNYSARGAGKTSLDLERMAEDGNAAGGSAWDEMTWEPVTLEGQRATQAQVELILGLTRETFRASAFLAQGDGDAFTAAKPADRKRILAAVLGLDRFDVPQELVRTDRKAKQQRIERLTGALERADVELAEKATVDEMLALARADVLKAGFDHAEAEADLADAGRALAAIEQERSVRTDAEAAVARASSVLAPLEQRAQAAAEAASELVRAEQEIAGLSTVEQTLAARQAVVALEALLADYRTAVAMRDQVKRDAATRSAQRDAILAQAQAKDDEAHRLDAQAGAVDAGELAHCAMCAQELGADAKISTLASLRARAVALDDEQRALLEQASGIEIPDVPAEPEPPLETQQQLATARATVEAVRTDELKRERLDGAVQILRERVVSAPPEAEVAAASQLRAAAASTLEALPAAPDAGRVAEVQSAALQAKAALEAATSRLDAAKTGEARAAAKAERLAELEQSTAADRAERETLQVSVDRLLILERAFGRDGIPALIVQGAAIPSIETEAARILGELGTSYRVELRTQKALAGGGMADALDVVVITETGERAFETFSGGERTRINLALRIALARLLASRRGAESQVLAIDEPDGLDEAGMAALARVLQGLNGTFARTYVISHVPDLRHAFDQVVEVIKDDSGLSRVVS